MLRLIIAVLFGCSLSWGAACTASVPGNWSAAATWGGTCAGSGANGTPGIGDTATINVAVTWDSSASATVGVNGAAPASMYLSSIGVGAGGGTGYAGGLSATCSLSITGGTRYSAAPSTGAVADCNVINGVVVVSIFDRGVYTVCPTGYTISSISGGSGATTSGTPVCNSTGTAAITMGSSGTLTIPSGTRHVRGTFLGITGSQSANMLILQAGAHLLMDMTQAAGGIYRIETYRDINATACTANSPCSIEGEGGNTAIVQMAAYHQIRASYTTFKNVGDASQYSMQLHRNGSIIQHCIFDTSGLVYSQAQTGGDTFTFSGNLFKNTPIQNPLRPAPVNMFLNASASITTGTRNVTGNAMDGTIDSPTSATPAQTAGFTISGNFITGMGTGNSWASWTNNLLRVPTDTRNNLSLPYKSSTNFAGTGTYTYVHLDSPGWQNPHVFVNEINQTTSNSIYSSSSGSVGDSGEWLTTSNLASTFGTITFSNNIFTCDATGVGPAEVGTIRSNGSSSPSYVATNNTYCGGYNQFGFFDTNEDKATTAGSITMRNNLMFALASSSSLKIMDYSPPGTTDVCTTCGSTSNCDYNGAYNFTTTQTTPVCTGCTNQGRGYAGVWSSTPGAHDVDGTNPNFLDSGIYTNHARKLENFDTGYLGQAVGTAWSSGGTYVLGDVVSNSATNTYNAETFNFRCWNASGCTGAPAPGFNSASQGVVAGATSATVTVPAAANLTTLTLANLWCYGSASGGGQNTITSWTPTGSPVTSVVINFTTAGTNGTTCVVLSDWRDYWEWNGAAVVKAALYAGTTYTDSGIGCGGGCTPIEALNNWVIKGYTPQSSAFLGTGYLGANIGAVTPVVSAAVRNALFFSIP